MVSNYKRANKRRRGGEAPGERPKNSEGRGERASGPVPKRKYALIFGYNGIKYHGMQKQVPGTPMSHLPTIEGELEKALNKIGAFTEAQINEYARMQWSRVGRTDRGVHAVCQVVTCKLTLGPVSEEDRELKTKAKEEEASKDLTPEEQQRANQFQQLREIEFVQKLREVIPDDFVIHDITRVPANFDARFQCQQRQYEYCFPAYVVRKCELFDNVATLHEYFQTYAPSVLQSPDQQSSALHTYRPMTMEEKRRLYDALQNKEDLTVPWEMTKGELGELCLKYRYEMYWLRRTYSKLSHEQRQKCWIHFHGSKPTSEDDGEERWPYPPPELLSIRQKPLAAEERRNWKMSEEEFTQLEGLLKRYLGHNHWFNYTSRLNHDDPSGARAIHEIRLIRAFQNDEGELLVVRLRGMSFLLNQIRKMMSMAFECMIGTAPYASNLFLISPPLNPKKHLHLAPGEGLMLERAYFDTVNRNTKQEITGLTLHHQYELDNPFGDKMEELLNNGILEEEAPAPKYNPLVDSAPPPAPAAPIKKVAEWFDKPEHEWPTWFKILRFKIRTIYPEMMHIFNEQATFNHYINDIQWHPFFTENFPEPCPKDFFKRVDQSLNGEKTQEDGDTGETMNEEAISAAAKEAKPATAAAEEASA